MAISIKQILDELIKEKDTLLREIDIVKKSKIDIRYTRIVRENMILINYITYLIEWIEQCYYDGEIVKNQMESTNGRSI